MKTEKSVLIVKSDSELKKLILYFCNRKTTKTMKPGDKALIDPKVTGLSSWIEGVIIKIRNNPFIGKEIAIKDNNGNIYFEAAKYFKILTK